MNRDAVACEILDRCRGTRSETAAIYYHATLEHPYTLGCFHGTPLRIRVTDGSGGQPPPPPPVG
jgi:hypothetical protein